MIADLSIFFASYFQYLVVAGLLIFWFLAKTNEGKKQNRIMVVLALLSAVAARFIFVDLIRFFYYRPRPFAVHQVFQLINHDLTGSFPSGHAAFFFALAVVVYFYNRKISIWFFIGALLIGLARVFVGIHYPLDILGGAMIGIFTGWLIYKIFSRKNFLIKKGP